MDTSDKNIEKVFTTYSEQYEIDLEDLIMDKLSIEKNYNPEIFKSKRRTKIGIILSAVFLFAYFVLTYFDTLPKIDHQMNNLDVYMPTIFMGMMVLIMYLLTTLSFKPMNRQSIITK